MTLLLLLVRQAYRVFVDGEDTAWRCRQCWDDGEVTVLVLVLSAELNIEDIFYNTKVQRLRCGI